MSNNEKKLVKNVKALVAKNFGGSYERAFQHYAVRSSSQPTLDENELKMLLEDADIGNMITRGTWASTIIRELDQNADGKIGWSEFADRIGR